MATETNDMKTMTMVTFIKRMKRHRKLYIWTEAVVMVITAILIYSVPRTYTAQTALAPEAEQQSAAMGSLGMIASQLGVDLSSTQTTDAISPALYPELMNDNKFVVDLLKIQLHTSESAAPRTYLTYLTRDRKRSWMAQAADAISAKLTTPQAPQNPFKNPYMLSKDNERLVEQIRDDISISVDRQTGVINVFATAQDPLACKLLADSCTEHLKAFIVKYRTSEGAEGCRPLPPADGRRPTEIRAGASQICRHSRRQPRRDTGERALGGGRHGERHAVEIQPVYGNEHPV